MDGSISTLPAAEEELTYLCSLGKFLPITASSNQLKKKYIMVVGIWVFFCMTIAIEKIVST